jgi:hypothetical protein
VCHEGGQIWKGKLVYHDLAGGNEGPGGVQTAVKEAWPEWEEKKKGQRHRFKSNEERK